MSNDGDCSCVQCMADFYYKRGYMAGYQAGRRSAPAVGGQEQLFTDDQYDFTYDGLLP